MCSIVSFSLEIRTSLGFDMGTSSYLGINIPNVSWMITSVKFSWVLLISLIFSAYLFGGLKV